MSNLGFIEAEHFTKVGIIYVESNDLILQGPMFNTRLTITCKTNKDKCLQILDEIEKELLKYWGKLWLKARLMKLEKS